MDGRILGYRVAAVVHLLVMTRALLTLFQKSLSDLTIPQECSWQKYGPFLPVDLSLLAPGGIFLARKFIVSKLLPQLLAIEMVF